jgi:methionyl-tRNA synthetase
LERDFRDIWFNSFRTNRRSRIAFAKIEDEEIQKQIDKLEATKVANKRKQNSRTWKKKRFDDFAKMDMRVGTIRSFENAKSE